MAILKGDTRYCIDTLISIAKITTNQQHREMLCQKAETILLECMQAKTLEDIDIEKTAYIQSTLRSAVLLIAMKNTKDSLCSNKILKIAEENNIFLSMTPQEIGRLIIKWREYFWKEDNIAIKVIKNGKLYIGTYNIAGQRVK